MKGPGLPLVEVETQAGAYRLQASAWRVGGDCLVCITGGEAHLGAVAMATPRPSQANPERASATTSVFTFIGHQEDMLARQTAQTLASALGARVVVTAGCHWDDLEQSGIDTVLAHGKELMGLLLERLTQ